MKKKRIRRERKRKCKRSGRQRIGRRRGRSGSVRKTIGNGKRCRRKSGGKQGRSP